ncbi:MAG TPA: hypothetical protein VGS58_20040, partial [Candidatus Sulfopaludibacter sp.]|nr:hypothetical protein [Candidatus Sulfopaludibacter sp.]
MGLFLAVLALAICTGTLQAGSVVTVPSTVATSGIALTCDASGVANTAVPVYINLASGSTGLSVTATAAALPAILPSPATKTVISSTGAGTQFNFTAPTGCAGITSSPMTVTINFQVSNVTQVAVTATITVVNPPLSAPSPNSITLACDYLSQSTPASQSVNIKLASPGTAPTVAVTASAGSAIVLPAPASVASTTVTVPFAFHLPTGCGGATNGQMVTLTFTPGGVASEAQTVQATMSISNSPSVLVPAPSSVSLTCAKNGGSYTGDSKTVNVTAPSATVFTMGAVSGFTASGGGSASTTASPVTISVSSGQCAALQFATNNFSVHLVAAPAQDKVVPVTIQVMSVSPLSPSPASVTVPYTKGTSASYPISITPPSTTITANTAAYFSVDPSSVPLWVNVSPASGSLAQNATQQLTFTPTAGADTLAVGSYSATVHIKVSGYLDLTIPLALQLRGPQSLRVSSDAITNTWAIGSAVPSLVITPISTDAPIPYNITTGADQGGLVPTVSASQLHGLAYSFGTPISVTFPASAFTTAAPGDALRGHVTITPVDNTITPVTVSITYSVVAAAALPASIGSISPANLPAASSGTFTVALSGSGFTSSTVAGIVNQGYIVSDSNVVSAFVNSSTIVLTITATTTDTLLPFSIASGTSNVQLGVCNPVAPAPSCSTPTGSQATLTIGVLPIIQAITSASSYVQATPPSNPTVAPYDILSIFGTNFCVSAGTGCVGGNALLYGQTDATLRYLTTLSPDNGTRNVSVAFQTQGASPSPIGTAPLLFATNNQINLMAPDALKNHIGETLDVVVSFGGLNSNKYAVTIGAIDPGIFTIGGDGQGDAAALLSPNYALVSSTTPAGVSGTASDTVMIYLTGLGMPDSDGTGASQWGSNNPCMATGDYFAAVNAWASTGLASDDGLVLQSALFPSGKSAPCFLVADAFAVTIGGVAGTVNYAGWVPDSIAGLYQINVQLPTALAFPSLGSGSNSAFKTSPSGSV